MTHRPFGRPIDSAGDLAARWKKAGEGEAYRGIEATIDLSADNHREGEMRRAAAAGFDDELASAMYRQLDAADSYPILPSTRTAIRAISAAGIAVGVVSDFHRDLRTDAAVAGFADEISHWSISCRSVHRSPMPGSSTMRSQVSGPSPAEH